MDWRSGESERPSLSLWVPGACGEQDSRVARAHKKMARGVRCAGDDGESIAN